jgi:CRP-like cAMP-binding protein
MIDTTLLAAIPLLQGLQSDQLQQIARLLCQHTPPARATVVSANDPSSELLIIITGATRIYADQPEECHDILAILGPGALTGERALEAGKYILKIDGNTLYELTISSSASAIACSSESARPAAQAWANVVGSMCSRTTSTI